MRQTIRAVFLMLAGFFSFFFWTVTDVHQGQVWASDSAGSSEPELVPSDSSAKAATKADKKAQARADAEAKRAAREAAKEAARAQKQQAAEAARASRADRNSKYNHAAKTQAVAGYRGVVQSGDSPLAPKTHVVIIKTPDSFQLAPLHGDQVWNVPVKSIRGAQVAGSVLWLYWFSKDGATLTAAIDISAGEGERLSSEINAAVKAYHDAFSTDTYRSHYEEYRSKALQGAH